VDDEVSISRFKATCLALLAKVRRTRRAILVTRTGEPIAQIAPPSPPEKPASWLGSFSATGRITGDIVSPPVPDNEWKTLRS
jgi:antitoxin (DNA-binding transcriptional repressor) of toxin-antitoxin stability system